MSTSTQWFGSFTQAALCKGSNGFVVEGTVNAVRVHSVFVSGASESPAEQADRLPTRFVVVVIDPVVNVYERMYDRNREEIDYQWNLGRVGTKNYHEPKPLTPDQLASKIGDSGSAAPAKLLEEALRNNLHPNRKNVFEFWIDDSKGGAKDL